MSDKAFDVKGETYTTLNSKVDALNNLLRLLLTFGLLPPLLKDT